MALPRLLLILGCCWLAARGATIALKLNTSLAGIYTIQNPLQLYLGDVLRLTCQSSGISIYRLTRQAEYISCTTTEDNVEELGQCVLGEGQNLTLNIEEPSGQTGSSIIYVPGNIYYIVGFVSDQYSGPPCSQSVKMVVRVDLRPTTTQKVEPAGLTPSDGEEGGLPWLYIAVAAGGGAFLLVVLIIFLIVVVVCVCASKNSKSSDVKVSKSVEGGERGSTNFDSLQIKTAAETTKVDSLGQIETKKVNGSSAPGRKNGDEDKKTDFGSSSPKKSSQHVGKPSSYRPSTTNPKTKKDSNSHTDGVSFSKKNEKISISNEPPSASSGVSSKTARAPNGGTKPNIDEIKAARTSSQNGRLHSNGAASTNSPKPPLKKTVSDGSSMANSSETKKPRNPAPPPPRPPYQPGAGSRSLSIQTRPPTTSAKNPACSWRT